MRTTAVPCSMALALATVGAPCVVSAQSGGLLNLGLFGGLHGGPAGGAGAGVEASHVAYGAPISRNAFCYGPFVQAAAFARGESSVTGMFVAGAEVAYGGAGIEGGLFAQTAGGAYGAALGVHVAPYLSLGYVWFAVPIHIPLTTEAGMAGVTASAGFVAGFKIPIPTFGNDPRSSLFRMPGGRPLTHQGRPVVARVAESPAWIDDVSPEVGELTPELRAHLARQWLDDALSEHASVLAFTRVAMQLLAAGAPPELVEEAHRSALDEVRHARLCFTVSSMYGERWNGPGALAVDAVREARCDAATIARESLLDGCAAEGYAAAVARESLRRAEDPELQRVLTVIADDEARHAAFAWKVVAWCAEVGGEEAAVALAEGLRALPDAVPLPTHDARFDDDTLGRAGRAPRSACAGLRDEVLRAVAERAWQLPALRGRVSAISPRRGQPRARRG